MSAAVGVRDLWVRYDSRWVLEGVSLTVPEGALYVIVGPNGGGKTTLLRTILGMVRPQRGQVQVFGLSPEEAVRKGWVGYLPQRSMADLTLPLRAIDVVLLGIGAKRGLFGRVRREDRERAMEALQLVGMEEFAETSFGQLSGGQAQRVQIARVLAENPRLLLLDEPSTGVDAVAQESFYRLLRKLKEEKGLTIVMVTHDVGGVTEMADGVACLNCKLRYHGDPKGALNLRVLRETYGTDVVPLIHRENHPHD